MINPAPFCNTQPPFAALGWRAYEKLGEQCCRGSCDWPGPAWDADAFRVVRALAPDYGA